MIKKKIAAVLSAVMCCSVMSVMGVQVSAQEAQAPRTIITSEETIPTVYATKQTAEQKATFKAVRKIVNIPYDTKLAAKIKSCEEKTSKTTVSYSKSKTKKVISKMIKSFEGSDTTFRVGMRNNSYIIDVAVKGSKVRIAMYMEGMAIVCYSDGKNAYMVDPATKTYYKMNAEEADIDASSADYTSLIEDINADLGKAEVFTFTYKEEKYTYEKFENNGFLFNSKGTLVMAYEEGEIMGCKMTTSVPDSTFKLPSGYTEVEFDM